MLIEPGPASREPDRPWTTCADFRVRFEALSHAHFFVVMMMGGQGFWVFFRVFKGIEPSGHA